MVNENLGILCLIGLNVITIFLLWWLASELDKKGEEIIDLLVENTKLKKENKELNSKLFNANTTIVNLKGLLDSPTSNENTYLFFKE